jgi:hypothetical protein
VVFLPVLFIGGCIALFAYAVLAEAGALLLGKSGASMDPRAAREMARRVCVDAIA